MKKYTRKALILGTILAINLNLSADNLSNALTNHFNKSRAFINTHPNANGGNPRKRFEIINSQEQEILEAHELDILSLAGDKSQVALLKDQLSTKSDHIEELEKELRKVKRALKRVEIELSVYTIGSPNMDKGSKQNEK